MAHFIKIRVVDGAWALISIALAAEGLLRSSRGFEDGIAITLNLIAGALFLMREPHRAFDGSAATWCFAACSIAAGFLFRESASPPLLGDLGIWLMRVGGVLAIVTTCSLGRAFGVLPAYRSLRISGPFALVRHPLYACYIAMDVGFLLVAPRAWNVAVFGVSTALFVGRIWTEETLLSRTTPVYAEYRRAVPYRLVPGLW